MALFTRQPFAELGTPRLQALQSAKNRQNAISPSFSSSPKQNQPSNGKRRAAAVFEDDDSENVDPSIFTSPTKKSKTFDDGFSKPSKFSLVPSPASKSSLSATASPAAPSVRKALSSPSTSTSTPIRHSRGSPKHKRISLLSKRRASSSPFRRVDPPSFSSSPSSPSLPFSIDAALKGSIPDYTPKSAPITATTTPSHGPTTDEPMPKSWFFDIHEDTPEQEAANLMEHSAAVLDISSDDDSETKRRNDELECGKENIPPPDFVASEVQTVAANQSSTNIVAEQNAPVEHSVKRHHLRNASQDAMEEDREPLKDLPAADFYGKGLDATSYVTVDAGMERPSGLSREIHFSAPTPEKKRAREDDEEEDIAPQKQEEILIYVDETTGPQIDTPAVEETVPAVLAESDAAP